MPSITPSTERQGRRQQGQAIVLIAVLLLVLFGMLGLAIDAGRAYVDRRTLQDAVDAATLAAGDWYDNYGDTTGAFTNGYDVFQRNLSLSGGSSTQSGAAMTATWPGGYSLTITGTDNQFNGYVFQASATHIFPLTFFQVLGSSPTIPVQSQASAIVGSQWSQPALLTLSTSGCSLGFSGSSSVTVRGDVYSNGCISFQGSSSLGVAGNVYSASGIPPSGITLLCYDPNPDVPPYSPPCGAGDTLGAKYGNAPVLPDPGYQSPGAGLPPAAAPTPHTGWTEMHPGAYVNLSENGHSCFFLDAGIYSLSGGYQTQGSFLSNELKPPDEPAWNYASGGLDYTARASPQFYTISGPPVYDCSGTFTLTAGTAGQNLTPSSSYWAVELTSVRTDVYKGVTYYRESAPSMCREVYVNGASRSFTVDVGTQQQVPGATSYNVYVTNGHCGGAAQSSFGYVGTFTETQHSLVVDGSLVPSGGWQLGTRDNRCPAGRPQVGCAPPDGERKAVCMIGCTPNSNSGLPQDNPDSALLPGGDLANENYCLAQSGNPGAPCAGASVTPGAVQLYFPGSGDCIQETGQGATWVFSGYQYDWIVIFQGARPNSCGNSMQGGSNTQYIGTVYTPGATWTINGGNRAPLSGQVITSSATINGNSTIGISFNPQYAPAPPAAHLIQ